MYVNSNSDLLAYSNTWYINEIYRNKYIPKQYNQMSIPLSLQSIYLTLARDFNILYMF